MRRILLAALLCLAFSSLRAQILADFETVATTPALSPTGVIVVDNPSVSDGNQSSKSAYFSKPGSDWQAVYLNFPVKKNTGSNDRLSFKVYTSTVGRVYIKIVDGSTTKLEGWAPTYGFMPNVNEWTTCMIDISTIKNIEFDRLEVNVSVNNTAPADVYVDDFKLYNSLAPNGEPVINLELSATKVTLGTPISFDASGSEDLDGTISSYHWDFGDATSGTSATMDHTYTEDGIFQVILTLTDNDQNESQRKFFVYVSSAMEDVSTIKLFTAEPKTFEKIEAGFVLSGTYTNPYNPDEIAVNAIITLPDASTLTVPCFYYEKGYYQSFDDRWLKDDLYGYWMVRFSSPQIGEHKIKFQVIDASGTTTSTDQSIQVAQGTRSGYIRMDPDNHQYYRHSTGEPYYPMGINAAWDNTSNYNLIINNLSDGGANLVRYWQVPFDRQGLEWTTGFYQGLGIYSQEAAAEQDSIMALCEANNVFLQIVLFQHGMYSENVNSNWSDNPYNAANGGMLTKAEQFFYNADAKARTKKLIRYIVARWGYSANLFAWELFNEVQFTGMHNSQSNQWATGVITWHDEMGQFIKSIDPFDHIVSTSASDNQLVAMKSLTGLDNLQYHLYNPNLLTTQIDTDNTLNNAIQTKGLINGEYGLDVTTADVPLNVQRLAIWTGIFSQVPHLMWLWENYTTMTWANLFKAPALFLADKDFVNEGPILPFELTAKFGTETIGSLGFSTNENFYALIFDTKDRPSLSGVKVDFTDFPKGIYSFTYTNVTSGAENETSVEVTDTQPIVTLPNFAKGIVISAPLLAPITGVEEDQMLRRIIGYPNPTNSEVSFIIPEQLHQNIEINIYNTLGKKIGSQVQRPTPGEPLRINMRQYGAKSGMFIFKMKIGESSIIRKVIYEER